MQIRMKNLAALLMFVSWLLVGVMPAAAGGRLPFTVASEMQVTQAGYQDHQAHRHDGVRHSTQGSTAETSRYVCAMALCPMCLTVLPLPPHEVMQTAGLFSMVSYGADVLVSSSPRRLERPPWVFG